MVSKTRGEEDTPKPDRRPRGKTTRTVPRPAADRVQVRLIAETYAGFARNSKTGHRGDDARVFKDRNRDPLEARHDGVPGGATRTGEECCGVTKRGSSRGGPPRDPFRRGGEMLEP